MYGSKLASAAAQAEFKTTDEVPLLKEGQHEAPQRGNADAQVEISEVIDQHD